MQKISALGLDVGSKRIGVAGCDGTGLIASGSLLLNAPLLTGMLHSCGSWLNSGKCSYLLLVCLIRWMGR
jgi:hypothetical protein